MKVGDLVRLSSDEPCIQQVWRVTAIKSDSRGIWFQHEDNPYPDVWHAANYYEVINEM